MSNNFTTIKIEINQQIVHLRLNRPDKLNAINLVMLEELSEAVDIIEENDQIKCVVISGEGKRAFSSGADLSELQKLTTKTAKKFSIKGQQVFSKIESVSKPVLAAIDGYALGGGLELALACDFRIATNNARFGFPEIKLGFAPAWGGTQRIQFVVGASKAKQLVVLGKSINAKEALKIGLVDTVVPLKNLENEIESFTQRLCKISPVAFKQVKNKLFCTSLDEGFEKETEMFVKLFSLPETKNNLAGALSLRNKK